MCEAEQESIRAKGSPEGRKEFILKFPQGAVGCQLLFRNPWGCIMSTIAMD